MKKINLIFGTHNHQPIGNFDSVFEECYQKSYKPFLDVFQKFPSLKIAKHYTGILLDWLESNRPELLKQLKTLVDRGNIEVISGGFYEPILAVIPDEDKIAQVQKLTKFVKKHFGTTATGLWLAERIWEQHLVKPLAQAGIKYVILDDTHFKYAGLTEDQLYGYYISEEQGYTVNLFPISKTLRYSIPFQDVSATIDYLRSIATEEGDRMVVFADDGEKFGAWPGMYEHIYSKNHWLEKFFEALHDNRDWINTITFQEALEKYKPIGRIYLSNASYAEMMHWALPSKSFKTYETFEHRLKEEGLFDDYNIFVRGGFWRNFMVKYPESNQMHKKMLEVSHRARQLEEKGKKVSSKTIDKIMAAQCNCPYWHGVFGGTYLPNLRHPIYQNLIDAETDLDKLDGQNEIVSLSVTDFDKDGQDEVVIKNSELGIYIKPKEGGMITELDYKPASKNLLDIVSRREEGYHERLKRTAPQSGAAGAMHESVMVKELGLESHLNYDWYRHGNLVDHFVPHNTTAEEFYRGTFRELGDFVHGAYEVKTSGTKQKQVAILTRKGHVHLGGKDFSVEVEKIITVLKGKPEYTVDYSLRMLNDSKATVRFAVENCYGLLAGNAPDRYYYFDNQILEENRLVSIGEVRSPMVGLKDEWLKINAKLESNYEATVIRFPIETISLSEGGFEKVYQGSVVMMCYDIELSKKPIKISLTQRFMRS
ncbi:MAG: alpha-amylase/4-alpha-glucanotransferase domain-containing protein [Chloroherpetonaceae bacterium]|nr:alpha-amylase/4-alpha-glucanotransferase domain-containing protein [Chloroherpetonaceae bacterium]